VYQLLAIDMNFHLQMLHKTCSIHVFLNFRLKFAIFIVPRTKIKDLIAQVQRRVKDVTWNSSNSTCSRSKFCHFKQEKMPSYLTVRNL